jgi:hypothetical protein
VVERLDGTTDKLNPRLLLGSTGNTHQAYGGILVNTQHCVADQLDRSSTATSHMNSVAFTQSSVQFRATPPSALVLDMDVTFDAREPRHRIPAKLLRFDTDR